MTEVRPCAVCGRIFAPSRPQTPAEEAGAILAVERYGDAGMLCRECLASRGTLAMMYGPEGRDG